MSKSGGMSERFDIQLGPRLVFLSSVYPRAKPAVFPSASVHSLPFKHVLIEIQPTSILAPFVWKTASLVETKGDYFTYRCTHGVHRFFELNTCFSKG